MRASARITRTEDRLFFDIGGVNVGEYVFRQRAEQSECPRPFFRTLRTRSGRSLTGFRPRDHRWHRGLSFAVANVGAENFWGGPTFVRGAGYRQLANVGSQEHVAFESLEDAEGNPLVREELDWVSEQGRVALSEKRAMSARAVDDHAWVLGFESHVVNGTGSSLVLGSPGTRGREGAGYGGLFWRGPRSFTGGDVLAPERVGGDDLQGIRSPWMAFVGTHDGVTASSTVLMTDAVSNRYHPPRWFVRADEYPGMGPAPFFSEDWTLDPDEVFISRVAIVLSDGAADLARADFLNREGQHHLALLERS